MRVLTLGAPALLLLLLATPVPARAQTVEAVYSMTLTVKVSQPTSSGSRIVSARLSTRDLTEAMMQDMGISGRRAHLAIRRDIADLGFENAEVFLVVDGAYFFLDGFRTQIPAVLPPAFDAGVAAESFRRGDGALQAITVEAISAVALGDLFLDGYEIALLGVGKAKAKLTTFNGVDLGFLYSKIVEKMFGGVIFDFQPEDALPVSGTLTIGSERIVGP